MEKLKNLFLKLLFVFLFSNTGFSQQQIDTLLLKSYDDLFELFNTESNFEKKIYYLNVWTKKAKEEKNIPKLMSAYQTSAIVYLNRDEVLYYCDSILNYSLGNNKYDYNTGSSYLIKGGFFYGKRDFKKAIDNYIKAKKYSRNEYLNFSVNSSIGILKDRIGEFKEALVIHKKNYLFAKKRIKHNSNRMYLNSIYAIANTFNSLRLLDSANYYNKIGVHESLTLKDSSLFNLFVLNQGTTEYHLRRYELAVDSLKKASIYFKKNQDLPNLAEAYYYLGRVYSKIKDVDKTVGYFKKVDTVFRQDNDVLPIIKHSYEYLIDYYREQDNFKSQLIYVNQLIKLDSILYTNEIYLNKNIIKKYDIPRLLYKKESIIKSLNRKEKTSRYVFVGLVCFLIVMGVIAVCQFKKRKIYKKRFEQIIDDKNFRDVDKKELNSKGGLDISVNVSEEIVFQLLSSLDSFEKNNGFIDSKINLQLLAQKFQTNTNYLSKVINQYKEMSLTNYISELRVEYAIKQLKTNQVFRKYTIKAIAQEVGFNNSESFAKAFYKFKGIKPSYFIRELGKLNA